MRKWQRVIKADVFIRGFYRKLISRGMQLCAKLIGGSSHPCREAWPQKMTEYVFTHKSVHSSCFFFFTSTLGTLGCGQRTVKQNPPGYLSCHSWMLSDFEMKNNNVQIVTDDVVQTHGLRIVTTSEIARKTWLAMINGLKSKTCWYKKNPLTGWLYLFLIFTNSVNHFMVTLKKPNFAMILS